MEEEEHRDRHLDHLQGMGVDPLVLCLDHHLEEGVDHLVPHLDLPQEVAVADHLGHHAVANLALLVHLITADMAPVNLLL